MVCRAVLERSVGGDRTRARSGADSPGPSRLLPGASGTLEGMAPRCAAALGRTLRARVARRGPRTGLARTRGSLGSARERLPAGIRQARAMLDVSPRPELRFGEAGSRRSGPGPELTSLRTGRSHSAEPGA